MLRRFESAGDAASVLATTLYQALPPSAENKLTSLARAVSCSCSATVAKLRRSLADAHQAADRRGQWSLGAH